MKTSRKILSLLLCLMVVIAAVGCGGGNSSSGGGTTPPATSGGGSDTPAPAGGVTAQEVEAAQPANPDAIIIRFASPTKAAAFNEQNSGVAVVDKYWLENLCARTDGRYKIEYFGDNQLASSTSEIVGGIQSNAFQMTTLAMGQWGEYTDAFAEMNVPFLFSSFDVVHEVLDNQGLGQKMFDKSIADVNGVKPLLYNTIGFRQITNSRGVVKVPGDLSGLKIRVMNDPIQIASFEALGVSVTNVAYAELFTALQQKLCDGQENPPSNIYNDKLYEVQKYLTKTNHSYTVSIFMTNMDFWNSLPAEDQAIFLEIAREAEIAGRNKIMELDQWYYDELTTSGGMELYEPTAEELKQFSDAMIDTVYPKCQEIMGQERWDALMTMVENAEAKVG